MVSSQPTEVDTDSAVPSQLRAKLQNQQFRCVILGTHAEEPIRGRKLLSSLLATEADSWPQLSKLLKAEEFKEIRPVDNSDWTQSRFFLGTDLETDCWWQLEIITEMNFRLPRLGSVSFSLNESGPSAASGFPAQFYPNKAWLLVFMVLDKLSGTRFLGRYEPVYAADDLEPEIGSEASKAILARFLPGVSGKQFAATASAALKDHELSVDLPEPDRSGAGRSAVAHRWQLRNPAPVVAFVGPKATGKSTLIEATSAWLSPFLAVTTIHTGKPPSLLKTGILNFFLPLARKLFPEHRITLVERKIADSESIEFSFLYLLRKYYLAVERDNLIRRAHAKADRGLIILADRYPSDVIGAVDSASFSDSILSKQKSQLKVLLMRAELRVYDRIPAPSVVINLTVPIEKAIHRDLTRDKDDPSDSEYVRFRHETKLKPQFTRSPVYRVSTDQALADSVRQVKALIWKSL